MVRQPTQIASSEFRIKLLAKYFGVRRAEPETDDRAGIAQDGVPDLEIELAQVLMGQNHADPVFAQLREHIGQTQRRKRLKFIKIDVEITAVCLGHVGAAQARKPDAGDQERAQQRRHVLADFALGQVHKEDSALVHELTRIKGATRLGDDGMERRVREKRPYLVLDRSDSLGAESRRVALEFAQPEAAHLGIIDARGGEAPEGPVIHQP